MSTLDRLIPEPRLRELESVDVAAPPAEVWKRIRYGELPQDPLIKALFFLRGIPARLAGRSEEATGVQLEKLVSTPENPGFQILIDEPCEVAVGAIGKVWKPSIPFRHVDDATAYAGFAESGWIKVAWTIKVDPRGERDSRISFEVRVDATDDASWRKFRRYWRLIGVASRIIRRRLLAGLQRDLGTPEKAEQMRVMPGDELLPDAVDEMTHGITIAATPEQIWPWLVQMGGGRAGFYSLDVLDNHGIRSAREIHPELQHVAIGQILPATPEGTEGFEVVRAESPRLLVLGGLFDAAEEHQLAFAAKRPEHFWHITWTFVLDQLDAYSTRLRVRVRGAYPASGRSHAAWIRPIHRVMQGVQLHNVAARAEQRLARDDWRDKLDGIAGALRIAVDFATPFARRKRATWGTDDQTAARVFSGDELVPEPSWGWTHAVEIAAPTSKVWPWVAQIGADRGGFYSYQWLENLVGCKISNAETVHPEWEAHEGGGLALHPKLPPLEVEVVEPGRCVIAHAHGDRGARARGKPWVEASWLFLIEPIDEQRCRFISRYRVAHSDDFATRAKFGASTVEPIGFAMDRRMLLGVKQRVERQSV